MDYFEELNLPGYLQSKEAEYRRRKDIQIEICANLAIVIFEVSCIIQLGNQIIEGFNLLKEVEEIE